VVRYSGAVGGEPVMAQAGARLHGEDHGGMAHPLGNVLGINSHRRSTMTWRAELTSAQRHYSEGGGEVVREDSSEVL
jgi:hypothetical protein